MMNQRVTLRQPTGETRSPSGASIPTYVTTETTMYLEPLRGEEVEEDRNTPIGTWLGLGRLDVDWDAWTQVVIGGLTLEITAPIRPFHNPSVGAASHVEMTLREIG